MPLVKAVEASKNDPRRPLRRQVLARREGQRFVPKSLRPSTGAASPSSSPSASGSSAQPSQCVKVPAGASGSSTTSASERVSSGTPDHDSGGDRSSPSQL